MHWIEINPIQVNHNQIMAKCENKIAVMMQVEGIRHIGDGLLEVGEDRLKEFLAPGDINDLYDVEQTPFAR